MTQRQLAGIVAVPLTLVLFAIIGLTKLPFATYQPGPTINVLGTNAEGKEIIAVSGHQTYRDDGQLRMVTVSVSRPDPENPGMGLYDLLGTWFNHDNAVYPYDVVYPEGQTSEQSQQEGAVDMVTSQDQATAIALQELGIKVEKAVEVYLTQDGSPADGKLQVRDVFVSVNGAKITDEQSLVTAIQSAPAGQPITFVVLRAGKRVSVDITPKTVDGKQIIGIQLGIGYTFPFQVSVGIDPDIGGPSAGLMFSLSIYDTLTPGSLTGGDAIAGTGTINADGSVGPIGGIQQKIAGSLRDGAKLFLVPPDNCADAMGAHNGDMRLVKAPSFHSALTSIQAWAADHDAKLPSCEGS